MRVAVYGCLSVGATVLMTLQALHQHKHQFFPAMVQLGRSSGGSLVLLNVACFIALSLGRLMQAVFLGPLRVLETEHLQERLWFAVTETFLAMTVFRDQFDARFVLLLLLLLLLKSFHWLLRDRIDYMEQTPIITR